LNSAFARHHVLVIRDQKLSPGDFARAAENLGKIMPQAIKGHGTQEHPDVFELRPMAVAPGQYRAPGGDGFHTDHSFDPCPPKATSLHAVVLPSKGGDTQFCNVHLAYDDLPEQTKRRIDGLRAVHAYYSRNSAYKVRQLDAESLAALPPPAVHPLVGVHPENSKRYLYVNQSRMESIEGMDDADAMELISQLLTHATQSQYEYRHVWRSGDMVIWDNRSVLHKANGDYDMREGRGRLMYRIMLKGTAPVASCS
jgi:taurine dioxygenase